MANPFAGQRLRLHSGPSRGTKAMLGFLLVMAMVILVPALALIAGGLTYGFVSHLAGVIVGVAVGIPLELLLAGRLLWVFRTAAWLERTTLAVRGTLTTRRCDLAAASELALGTVSETQPVPSAAGTIVVPTGRRIPRLSARDAGTGRWVRLRLLDPATRQRLPAPKLAALADAISARPQGVPDAAQARQVAGTLRAMANDPLAFLR